MHFSPHKTWWALLATAATLACGGDSTGPVVGPPARLNAISDGNRTATAGEPIPGGIVVKVTDASGHPVTAASVAFAVTVGNGSTSPRIAVTDAKGEATATWTLGTIAGANEVVASTPEAFAAVFKNDLAKFAKVVKDAKIPLQD